MCGFIAKGAPPTKETLAAMTAALRSTVAHSHVGDKGALAVAGAGDLYVRDGLIIALLGRVRFADRELLDLSQREGPAAALARLFADEGERAFAALTGPFLAAIIDEPNRSAYIAVDRMGAHSLTYTVASGTLVFSTSGDAISAHPLVKKDIDPQAIYQYLYFHMVPAPATIYRGQHRLLPGEYLVFADGRLRTAQYWSMRFAETHHAPFADLKQEFMNTLREAVREASADAITGAFLSGGTDSSTMAGLLGEVTGRPAPTYSIGFEEPGYDEMQYARITARHFATEHHEYYVTPDDVVSAIPQIAAAYDQPFGNSSAVPTLCCARLAKEDGIERLIGGDGGDELFGGNERYAKQYVFSLYEHIPASLREGLVGPLLRGVPTANGFSLLRKAKSYVEQASVAMPARLETYNLLDRIGRERIFTAPFLHAVDSHAPLMHIEQIYHRAEAQSLINRMLALDLRITLADNDLPKVKGMCALAGIDVTFPLLADEVVSFSARLAPELKLKGTKLRFFFKEALRGFLPEAIITKQKHGFGLPFGPWLTRHKPLQKIVAENLESLKDRAIIRSSFIDELTAQHLAEHAGYYGTLVWILVMLEQWMQKRAPDYSFPADR
jgi:asparagine synthase (glutamine-hydrolysing)